MIQEIQEALAPERYEETKVLGAGIVRDQWFAPKALFAESVPAPVRGSGGGVVMMW